MYEGKKYLAVVPARGGSKGIPRKNIALLNGKPLIVYTILSALKSSYIDKVVVSTDDDEIADISKSYGADVVIRPKDIALDESVVIHTLLHVVSIIDEDFDSVVLLQPTSPLRKSYHINEAIELYASKGCLSLASVIPVRDHPLFIRKLADNTNLAPLIDKSSSILRQNLEKYYFVNGAIYINSIKMLNSFTSLNDNQIGYVMEQRFGIDVNEAHDLQIAASLLSLCDS